MRSKQMKASPKRRWSKEAILTALTARSEAGLPLNYQAVVEDDEALTGAARRYFGSWDNALIAAGHDPATIKFPRTDVLPSGTWTPETILEQIHADISSGLEVSAHAAQLRYPGMVAKAQQIYGSWEAAITAAGYDYSLVRKTRTWTPEQVIERIQALSKCGADLSDNTCSAYSPPLYGAAQTHFGSWPAALEAAGVNPLEARRTLTWSQGKLLSAIAQGRKDAAVRSSAKKKFGSWEAACAAAGVPSDKPHHALVSRVKERRLDLGLTQCDVAERLGSFQALVSYLERKQTDPRVSLALKVAAALECRVEDLFQQPDDEA